MTRDNLLDFFDDSIRSNATFLTYDDGYRTYSYSYDEIRTSSYHFAEHLETIGCDAGNKVVIWGENCPEWLVALWGCLLSETIVVPIDFRASPKFVERVIDIVNATALVVGNDLCLPANFPQKKIFSLNTLLRNAPSTKIVFNKYGRSGSKKQKPSLAEIIFTSGATAEPKGVQLTHNNILANIVPVEQEILKYKSYSRLVSPIRFLNLLPLSHMFGQAMSTFIPPMLKGTTVFMRGYNPEDIVNQIRKNRISVVVCVPKMLEVLKDYVTLVAPELVQDELRTNNIPARWWKYRRIHKLFGLKFWAFVVGAAPLDPKLETFWTKLGFLVIQGYGLTETAPIVTLNHPFRTQKGSVGVPIKGVDLKIAADGEILVRGDNVTSGYYKETKTDDSFSSDGWFHTGDLGSVDQGGRLTVKGRKKDVIVTAEGLNVFPEDIERVVESITGVREAGIIGKLHQSREHVHAVLVLEPNVDLSRVLRDANKNLEEHQKIRGRSIWPGESLPRTEGTKKLKRHELKRWVNSGANPEDKMASPEENSVAAIVQKFSIDRQVSNKTNLQELGLSSIEKIELLMALEQASDRTLDESLLAETSTIGELEDLLGQLSKTPNVEHNQENSRPPISVFPSWSQKWPAQLIRKLSLGLWLLPLTRLFAWIKVEGTENLNTTYDPVVFAANHQSHLDSPVILAALPPHIRYRVATAAAKEFFAAHFHPQQHSRIVRIINSSIYYLATLLFNVFPLPQRETGTRDAIRYLGDLLDQRISVLIFPEGRRTEDGSIDDFQPGIGMIASRLQIPIIPVRIEGLDKILRKSWKMAKPGHVRIAFGKPLTFDTNDYRDIAKKLEEAVRTM